MSKSQIKNPAGIEKYVARTKKRGHVRKSSKLSTSKQKEMASSVSFIDEPSKSKPKILSKKVKQNISFDHFNVDPG